MEINIPPGGPLGNIPDLRRWGVPFFILIFLFTSLATMFYQVGPDEMGVIQRFGRYVRTTSPGLRLKLPLGIETVRKIKVTHVFKEEFGFRTIQSGVRTLYEGREGETPLFSRSTSTDKRFRKGLWSHSGNPYLDESLMLTGDLNTAIVEWIVQYRVKDPVLFAFRIRNVRETIRNMSEAVMRLVVGDHTLNQVLTSGREEIRKEVEKELQDVLDSYGSGVEILNVVLQDVNPPDEVKPSFNEVNEARQEKEKSINQAWEGYNKVVPKAKGEAEKTVREAEGYALDRVNRAKGDAEKFLLVWEAYHAAPEVTRKRLYLETMRSVLPELSEKILIDESLKGILPLLDLSEKRETSS
ncbi:MAG: FtsH protease activity modulator HflK [Candidatus Omnitrophica bacterium]|nr:FtsH protease activity modulator HflK [Candidatus Omnitrophota bacterium]